MYLTKYTIFILLLSCPILHYAQLTEDFNDGDFTQNPVWRGEITKFIIENDKLRLLAPPEQGKSYLTTNSRAINDAIWVFSVTMDFNPSGANYLKAYLCTNNEQLDGPLQGYYVKMGGLSDEVSLYRQEGEVVNEIIDGEDGRLDMTRAVASIKVTRSVGGEWQLFTDAGNTGNFVEEGSVTDTTFYSSRYFGLLCNYTSTRSDKFYFDNISVNGQPYRDTRAPRVDSLFIEAANKLRLVFSEPVHTTNTHFSVDHGMGFPAHIDQAGKEVTITFLTDFPNGAETKLAINSVTDTAANEITPVELPFRYIRPRVPDYNDIVINEIMADPSPPVDLQETEYLEIMNISEHPYDLSGWMISDGRTVGQVSSGYILPGSYTLLAPQGEAFPDVNSAGVSPWPALNNSGETLTLYSPDMVAVDSVSYTSSWYADNTKNGGGYSLEQTDPFQLCESADNWQASRSESGGTPGLENSVFHPYADTIPPALYQVWALNDTTIKLVFSERVDEALLTTNNITIEPAIDYTACHQKESVYSLGLLAPLQKARVYAVIFDGIADCMGNIMERVQFEIALTEKATGNDVVINEVLFNPYPGGVDFVEIYNRSEKYLNLAWWKLASVAGDGLAGRKAISMKNKLLIPGSYLAITTNSTVLASHYPQAVKERLVSALLPGMPNQQGAVVLLDNDGQVIDSIRYSADMHFPMISDPQGISLERLHPDNDPHHAESWQSAASGTGYATPGYRNSHFVMPHNYSNPITVEPEVILPYNSGTDDLAQIHYTFEPGPWVMSAFIFNLEGVMVKELANNLLIADQGTLVWDGTVNGVKASLGIYIILIEIFNEKGEVQRYKEKVVVGSRF
ncbi:MAG: lamin tail domain-containing protein [Cyclobacteriaceae bacterium]|nr:lamin tail domain-containing protein [Cyclobacteriaceae bacterium]